MIDSLQPTALTLGGLHTFTHYAPQTIQDQRLLDELEKYYDDGRGWEFIDKCKHLIVAKVQQHNLTTTVGREFIAQVLCNTFAGTSGYVTHFAIGTNNTAATIGDTALGTEIFRKAVSSSVDNSNVANISTFIGATEANATWEEWGHFVDGTATVDSGTMLSHHIQQQVKASPNTVTVDSTYTINDA